MVQLPSLRRAKILATMGPALEQPDMLEKALKAGVNAIRLNFSHGDAAQHIRYAKMVREVAAKLDRPCALLADLMGPKIRIDTQRYVLKVGSQVVVVKGKGNPDQGRIGVTHSGWMERIQPGQHILLDDGKLELKVIKSNAKECRTQVLRGGELKPSKSLNIPGVLLGLPVLTPKDLRDLPVIKRIGIDWIAASFVSEPEDLAMIRKALEKEGISAPVISKIENARAVINLRAIIELSDGVMVARGDLGVEMPLEEIPTIQRNVIHIAREMGKLTIVATQMLETMMDNARPTRAEVTDVSTAALSRVDALMLSGETAAGKHPIETIQVMDRIIRTAERNLEEEINDVGHMEVIAQTCEAGLYLALVAGAKALVTMTTRGSTPRILSTYRSNTPVVVACMRENIYHRSALYYSVIPIRIDPVEEAESVFRLIEAHLKRRRLVKRGDVMIFLFGYPLHGKNRTNSLRRWEVK